MFDEPFQDVQEQFSFGYRLLEALMFLGVILVVVLSVGLVFSVGLLVILGGINKVHLESELEL